MNKQCLTVSIGERVYFSQRYVEAESAKQVPQGPGVYLICDRASGHPIYIGTSQEMHARLSGHLVYNPEKHVLKILSIADSRTRIWIEAILVSTIQPPRNLQVGIRLGVSGGRLVH